MNQSSSDVQGYQYQAILSEQSLGEILMSIYRHRVPGCVKVERAGVEKSIFLNAGAVIHASSSDQNDRLGAFMRDREIISEANYMATMAKRAKTERKYGEILVDAGVLSPARLFAAIQGQVEAIIWSLFNWQSGTVVFTVGSKPEDVIHNFLPLRQVILEGVLSVKEAKPLIARMGRKDTILVPSYSTQDLIEIALEEEQYQLIKMVDGKKTLYKLCTDGPFSTGENARLLYAFSVLRLIRADAGKSGKPVKVTLGES